MLLPHIKLLKNKEMFRISLSASFSAWFLKNNISLGTFYYLTKFHCLAVFTAWSIGQYVYCYCLLTRLWRHKFWNLPYLSNQAVFSTWPKSKDKYLNILGTKKDFEVKSSFLKVFIEENKTKPLEGEDPILSEISIFLEDIFLDEFCR